MSSKTRHPLTTLFRQLGLPDDEAAIDAFVARHAPLPTDVALCDALLWSPSQAQFMREEHRLDANWGTAVDMLAARLQPAPTEAA
jgi:hypothetical protein